VAVLREQGALTDPQPLSCQVAAVSVGVVGGRVRLDLPYEEDAGAEVDMNVVATDAGTLVEVQGTGEGATFARQTLDAMLDLALAGIEELTVLQALALEQPLERAVPARPAGRGPARSGPPGRGGCCWPPATPRSWRSCSAWSATR
jgi:ribonuclease PH